ncbi:hypothetical protein C2G38_2222664 [Gigaspora rosea]|uniref:Uncharacterized protein n=1 Tax=Gigaspora rosea TaxID=44941 RepID=A0A397UB08_9GLOM|nr:hypothetical protein C2G38_2222664 [Gigaspora rosea]
MPKRKEYFVKLISLGIIVENLHFGPFCCNWWLSRPDNNEIKNILRLWVIEIGKSNNSEWNFARPGYKSSFIYKYQQKRCIFVQEFDDDECKVTIYSGKNIIATFIDDNPDLVWKKIGLLHQFNGKQLFGLQETNNQHFIQAVLIHSCTSDDWTNDNVITKSTGIIELHSALRDLYPTGYEVKDRELRAWKAMLKNIRCTEITPFGKEESEFEFWTRSLTPEIDRSTLELLYHSGFLNPIPTHIKNSIKIFWNCFDESLAINKRGVDSKCRILSIIADNFSYEDIKNNLGVSSDAICYARKHARTHGPGNRVWNKPIITQQKMSLEKQQQLDAFLLDKANVIMSSYKVVSATNEPVHYFKNTKGVLWEKYHEQYPNSMQRTSFYAKLKGNHYIYREDLGGLCQTYYQYGYEVFCDLNNYIRKHVTNHLTQNRLLSNCENLTQFLK